MSNIGSDTITIYAGEDVDLDFTMSPVEDITTWDIELHIEGATFRITRPATIISGPAGTFTVALTALTTSIRPGSYTYDVWRTDPGVERVIALGTFTVNPVART